MNSEEPHNNIKTIEDLQVAILLGGKLYVVYEDGFLTKIVEPFIQNNRLIDKFSYGTSVCIFEIDRHCIFYSYEDALNWSMKVFRKRSGLKG